MASIIPQPINSSKQKLHPVKIDMTPMVDLGFLLITFFIFTTSMMSPHVAKLTMPKESKGVQEVQKKTLLTAILDKEKVTVYEGSWEDATASNTLHKTNYNTKTGFGSYVRKKQEKLGDEKENMMVLIKPSPTSSYQELLNALDEMTINGVKRYAIVDASEGEKSFIEKN